jgi:putative membrane protein
MDLLVNILISGIAVFITSYLLPGVTVESFGISLLVGILLGVVNAFVKPILTFLTFPITILTMGLFMFVINALMILLVDALVAGFSVDNFWWALLFSLIVSLVSSVLRSLKA